LTFCEIYIIGNSVKTLGRREGAIWFLQTDVRDGKGAVTGKRLFAVYQDRSNTLSFLNPGILRIPEDVSSKDLGCDIRRDSSGKSWHNFCILPETFKEVTTRDSAKG
jgi:hypothetical protein